MILWRIESIFKYHINYEVDIKEFSTRIVSSTSCINSRETLQRNVTAKEMVHVLTTTTRMTRHVNTRQQVLSPKRYCYKLVTLVNSLRCQDINVNKCYTRLSTD